MRSLLCAVCLLALAAPAVATVYYQTSFDVDDSADWTMTGGTWTFDTTAGTVSKSSTGTTTFIRYGGDVPDGSGGTVSAESLADYTVTAEISRSGAGGYEGSDAAIIGRAKWLSGATYQYYMLRYNDNARTTPARQLQLYRVNASGAALLDTLDEAFGELYGFDPDQPYVLSLTMIGVSITGTMSQQGKSWSMEFVDAGTNVATGTGGLRVWQGSITCYDFSMANGASDDTTPPDAPTGLTTAIGDSVVTLDWTKNTESDLSYYRIYRSMTSGDNYSRIATVSWTVDSYVDNTVTNGNTYYYVMTAVDASGNESVRCDEVSATPEDVTPPSPPTGLTAGAGDAVVGLSWADNTEGDLDHYNVYRSATSGGARELVGDTDAGENSFLDKTVTNGTTYYYVVTAVDSTSHESGASNEAFATPSAPDPNAKTVLIETESFENKGGWVVDQQFMDQMGSPFLLAHGLTGPVADATTTITLPQTGVYRVWVRTWDWTSPWKEPYYTAASLKHSAGQSPGRFQVVVDDQTLAPASPFGTEGRQWQWQDGGTITVGSTMIDVALHDLTGYEGRCDAIVLTTDMAFMPPNEDPAMRLWREGLLGTSQPIEAGDYDLVVVGGGMAGCCAAISGARQGLSVALIQDRPVLGGNNSSEVRVGAKGETNFAPYPRIGDIVDELDSGAANKGSTSSYLAADQQKVGVVLNEPNIALYLNYRANEVETDANNIVAVIAEGTSTDPNIRATGLASVAGQRLRFTARCFADCTGDGVIGYLAGADWQMTVSDGQVHRMGRSNLWRFVTGGQSITVGPYLWALDLYNEATSSARFPTGSLGDWFWESGFFHNPFTESEYIRDWNFRAAYGAWDALKNHMGWTDYYPEWQAYISGKRETRRLLGDIILDDEDFFNDVMYPDGCVPTSWGRDLHFPNSTWNKGFEGDAFISSYTSPGYNVPYWIPYRCLYSRNIDNLFMAGRDISVTHEGLGPVRVMRTGGMMGEIVGMAASICKKHNVKPRAVYTDYLSQLQALMTNAEPQTHTNVALGKPVTVDSLYNATYVGSNAVDGDNRSTASRWLSADSAFPHWIEIDLQGEYEISQLRFWTGYTSYEVPPSDFQFQKWDGQNWVDIITETGNNDASYSRDFTPVSASRVRLYMTAGPSNIIKLFEIEVGVKIGAPPDAPTSLLATAVDGQVDLDWSDNNQANVTGYRVYRSQASGQQGDVQAATVTSNYVDDNVLGGIRYYYTVTAIDDAGLESSPSQEVYAPSYRGDLTIDGAVDAFDLSELAANWAVRYDFQTLADLAADWLKGTQSTGPPPER